MARVAVGKYAAFVVPFLLGAQSTVFKRFIQASPGDAMGVIVDRLYCQAKPKQGYYMCYNDGENPSPDLPSITTDPAEVNIDPFQQANTTVIASAPAGIKSIQKSDYDKEVQSRQNIEIIFNR